MKAVAMTSAGPTELLYEHYARLEKRFQVRSNSTYESLVVPNGNGGHPVHRWFRLKEAFSRDLLPQVLDDLDLLRFRGLRILDPFVGSGTTAVAAADLMSRELLRSVHVVGFECNPFLHLVASSKLRALQAPTTSFLPLAQRLGAAAARRRVEPAPLPPLATLTNDSYFPPGHVEELLRIRGAIDQAAANGACPLDLDLARVCLGASIEPSSYLRRDGRALRFVPDKRVVQPVAEFLRRAEEIAEDIPRDAKPISGSIRLGDGRTLRPQTPAPGTIDLVFFSPPYPNNIDYTEVYKMEAWLLGFIATQEQFSEQRLRTLYSHPSILRQGQPADQIDAQSHRAVQALIGPLIHAVPEDRYRNGRIAMLQGYARDMRLVAQAAFRALRPGGYLVYIVGNSAHGTGSDRLVVAADLLIARLATQVGFKVQSIEVARRPSRRRVDTPFLRESVIFARRPGANG